MHVAAEVTERANHMRGNSTNRTVDLPAHVYEPGSRGVQKNPQQLTPIDLPPIGELEGPHLRHFFIGTLEQGMLQPVDERGIDGELSE